MSCLFCILSALEDLTRDDHPDALSWDVSDRSRQFIADMIAQERKLGAGSITARQGAWLINLHGMITREITLMSRLSNHRRQAKPQDFGLRQW
jgi:hypothetical protein